jgi:hypothetical protein
MNPVVDDCLPHHARCDNEGLAALPGPTEGNELVSVPQKLLLVFCGSKV